jgi:hypothetical protein
MPEILTGKSVDPTRPDGRLQRLQVMVIATLRPAELSGTIGEPVLAAAALRIVEELIGRRLADVDKGGAARWYQSAGSRALAGSDL